MKPKKKAKIVKLPPESEVETYAVTAWRVHSKYIAPEMNDRENYLCGWSDCMQFLRKRAENETKKEE
jgi:hypothetical protein